MLPLEELTVGEMLRRAAKNFPQRPAMEYRGTVWSYQDLDQAVDEMARRLLCWGVKKGERVGIWCETGPETILAMYALVRIGGIAAMLNTSLRREELKGTLERSDISKLLIGSGYKDLEYPVICHGLTEEVPQLQKICGIGQVIPGEALALLAKEDMAPEEELYQAEKAVTSDDTAFMLYTSGTTGFPKAVLDSHYSRANCGMMQANDLRAGEHDRFCVTMPIFHCFCISVNIMAACAVGACLYLPESRHTFDILTAVQDGKCTVMSCVPTLFRALIARPDFSEWNVSSLRTGFIGGSMYQEKLFREIEEKLQFTLLSSLGQTEATAGLTTASLKDPLEVRAATVGHFMDHLEGKIIHPQTGEEQPLGQPGEICVRGYVVMKGYYKLPKETAEAVDAEGWLHTGDMGYLDENGNIHLTGRLKELIIRGGENISPAEIEAVLTEDERVEICKAVGVPDEHYGEEVCLCMALKKGAICTQEDIRLVLRGKLADYKVPKYILFMSDFPTTPTGKVRVKELRKTAEKMICNQ